MKKIYLSLFLLFAGYSASNAQSVLFVEEFDYPVGDSLAQHGWTVNSGGTTNAQLVTTPSLTYSGYPLSAGNAVSLTTSGQDVNKMFSNSVNSGSVYTSFLFNVSSAGNGDYFLTLGNSTSSTFFTNRFYVKSSGAGFVIGISKGTEAAVYDESNVLTFGTTYLAVTKYTFNPAATDDVSSLYFISGALPATEPSTPNVVNGTTTSGDLTNAARIFLRQGSSANAPNVIVDGIKVTTEWSQLLTAPVNMLSFDLTKQDKSVKLIWTSAQEKNAKEYVVERSANGKDNWQTIATVAAKGNTSTPTDYTCTDANPLGGTNFYRLKMVDLDGTYEYYKTVSINIAANINVKLYPNPAKDILYIDAKENLNDLHVDIFAASGTRVLSVKSGSTSVDISRLQAGVYFVKITKKGGATEVTKFIKM